MQEQAEDIRLGRPAGASILGISAQTSVDDDSPASQADDGQSLQYLQASIESGVSAGFQIASAAGPLCDEPLWGVAYEVRSGIRLKCLSESLCPSLFPALQSSSALRDSPQMCRSLLGS